MTELQTQTEQEEGAELYKEIVNMPILSQTEQEEGAELYKEIVNMPNIVKVKRKVQHASKDREVETCLTL